MHELFSKYNLKHLSISQIKTIKRSPFAWVCEKVLGRRSPPSEATAFGSFVHDNFERWLRERVEEPVEVYTSEEAKEFFVHAWEEKTLRFWSEYRKQFPFWPKAEDVETKFSTTLDDRLPPFIGFVDVIGRNDSHLWIQDHKTVGAKRYAYADAESLSRDPQLNLYAHALRGEEKTAVLQHNQLFKKIKRKPVNVLNAEVTWDHVAEVVEGIRKDALKAIEVLELYDKEGIEGFAERVRDQYVETRWDFGGCPHWDFFQECLQKRVDKVVATSYNKGHTKEEEEMPKNLHELVGKARDHFTAQGLSKFDLADAVVAAVVKNLVDKKTKAVYIRDGEGGDLIYNQLLNQISEKGIVIFKRVI